MTATRDLPAACCDSATRLSRHSVSSSRQSGLAKIGQSRWRLVVVLLLAGGMGQDYLAAGEAPLPRWRDNSNMVFLRGGSFTYPGHPVRIRSFYMDRYEVTNLQFCRFLNDGSAAHWNVDQEIQKKGDRAASILRRVHANGGVISTMCAGQFALEKAGLTYPRASSERPVAYDPQTRTATSVGPSVAVEAACLLLKQLVRREEYDSFLRYNPWLFRDRNRSAETESPDTSAPAQRDS